LTTAASENRFSVPDIYQESVLKDQVFDRFVECLQRIDLTQRAIRTTTLCVKAIPIQGKGKPLRRYECREVEAGCKNIWTVKPSDLPYQKAIIIDALHNDLQGCWRDTAEVVKTIVNPASIVSFRGSASFLIDYATSADVNLKEPKFVQVKFEIWGPNSL
jgi:hypothetical protein